MLKALMALLTLISLSSFLTMSLPMAFGPPQPAHSTMSSEETIPLLPGYTLNLELVPHHVQNANSLSLLLQILS